MMKTIQQLEREIEQLQSRSKEIGEQLYPAMIEAAPGDLSQARQLWMDDRFLRDVMSAKSMKLHSPEMEQEREELQNKAIAAILEPGGWKRVDRELPYACRNYLVKKDGCLYVAKLPRFRFVTLPECRGLINEIETALALDHPNIIKPVEYCLDTPYYVMPFYEGGTMAEADFDSWSKKEQEAYQSAIDSALSYARSKGFTPQDIGYQNVFLKADGRTPVIGDLEGWLNTKAS